MMKTIFLCLLLTFCISPPGKRAIAATYIDSKECGKIVFYEDGRFIYYIPAKDAVCRNVHSIPDNAIGNLGNYHFDSESSLIPYLSVRSQHVGKFEFRFSEDFGFLYVKRKGLEEDKWNRVK